MNAADSWVDTPSGWINARYVATVEVRGPYSDAGPTPQYAVIFTMCYGGGGNFFVRTRPEAEAFSTALRGAS